MSGDIILQNIQDRDMWDYYELNLGRSRITINGIKSLSYGIWDGLQVLNLGNNSIKDNACKYISMMNLPNICSCI